MLSEPLTLHLSNQKPSQFPVGQIQTTSQPYIHYFNARPPSNALPPLAPQQPFQIRSTFPSYHQRSLAHPQQYLKSLPLTKSIYPQQVIGSTSSPPHPQQQISGLFQNSQDLLEQPRLPFVPDFSKPLNYESIPHTDYSSSSSRTRRHKIFPKNSNQVSPASHRKKIFTSLPKDFLTNNSGACLGSGAIHSGARADQDNYPKSGRYDSSRNECPPRYKTDYNPIKPRSYEEMRKKTNSKSGQSINNLNIRSHQACNNKMSLSHESNKLSIPSPRLSIVQNDTSNRDQLINIINNLDQEDIHNIRDDLFGLDEIENHNGINNKTIIRPNTSKIDLEQAVSSSVAPVSSQRQKLISVLDYDEEKMKLKSTGLAQPFKEGLGTGEVTNLGSNGSQNVKAINSMANSLANYAGLVVVALVVLLTILDQLL